MRFCPRRPRRRRMTRVVRWSTVIWGVSKLSPQSARNPPSGRLIAALRRALAFTICVPSSFGRMTWPRRALRVGLTTFFQNLGHYEPAALSARPI